MTFDTIIFTKSVFFYYFSIGGLGGGRSLAAPTRVHHWRKNRDGQNEEMRSLNECTKKEEARAEWTRSKGI
jgi:hypothetical protein